MSDKQPGTVYLVGAGPGDIELATLKCRRLIEECDVLVYDYLANPEMVAWASAEAEKIYVGKKGGDHTVPQDQINEIIVEKAKAGANVVRLKGGDPFVFGRGGEEGQELREAGVRFEVVPGVTSGVAVPAYAGIPVTHREHCSQVTLLTGHDAQGREFTQVEWDQLARGSGTLCIYMGVKTLGRNSQALIDGGRAADTPCALIQWGTHPRQRTLVSTLEKMADDAEREGFGPPCIFVVGTVVGLREQLSWFETRPLFGKRVLVTRARAQASDIQHKLRELGAEPVPFPTIEIRDPDSWDAIDEAIGRLDEYEWIIWTSVNGVEKFFRRLTEKGGDIRELGSAHLAAIGPATAKALEQRGLRVEVVPREFDAEGLIAYFEEHGVKGKRVLIPRAKEAREVLPEQLRKMGNDVLVAPVYQSVLPETGGEHLRGMIENGELDLITFSSSSTVKNFFALVGEDLAPAVQENCTIACIGPITAKTAEGFGLKIDIQPPNYTIPELIDAVVAHYAK